jgi:hypothetical protein
VVLLHLYFFTTQNRNCREAAKKKKYHCSVDGCFHHRAKEGISFFTIPPKYLQWSNFLAQNGTFGVRITPNMPFLKKLSTPSFFIPIQFIILLLRLFSAFPPHPIN